MKSLLWSPNHDASIDIIDIVTGEELKIRKGMKKEEVRKGKSGRERRIQREKNQEWGEDRERGEDFNKNPIQTRVTS